MEILPLYKSIVGLQRCVYKIDSLYSGSLKLEDRDFLSYLCSLSKRFSNFLVFFTPRSGFTLILGSTHFIVAHSNLRIETFQVIYLLSQRGSLTF